MPSTDGQPVAPAARRRRGPGRGVALTPVTLFLCLAAVSALSGQEAVHPEVESIAAVRVDADGDGIPDRLGDTVRVSGRATTGGTVLDTMQLRLFVQDASAGIMILSSERDISVAAGDSVEATGTVEHSQGLTQVVATDYRVVPAPPRVPEPVELAYDPTTFERYEGTLVRLRAHVKGGGGYAGGNYVLLGAEDAAEGVISVFVATGHAAPPSLDRFSVGDRIEVTGPLAQLVIDGRDDEFYQIYPRSPGDVRALGLPRTLQQWIVWGIVGLLALAVIGLFLLRREVRRRTHALSEAMKAAKESEERLSFLLVHAPVVLWTVDRDLRFTWVEGRAISELGVSNEEVVGLTVSELLGGGDSASEPVTAFERAVSGEPTEFDVNWRGRVWEVRLQPMVENGIVTGVVGAAQDATHHREIERRLEEQSTHFQILFEESPEAIVLVNEEDRVIQVNPEFEELFGYTVEEAAGKLINELITLPERGNEATELTRRVAAGERVEVEALRRHRDGTPIEVSILSTPLRVGGENRVYGIYRDITEQKSLQAQLLHSQRLEAVGQLAGGIAHDFNNILTTILGHTRVLLEDIEDDEMLRDDLEQIEAAGERAARLTHQLLTFSRRDMISPRLVDLNALIERSRDFLGRLIEERVELEFQLADELPAVEADPGQLEQIVMNLVINARDATEGGGRVTISTGRSSSHDRSEAADADEDEEDWVVLEVRDGGRGMQEEERARMFEPFFTTKLPGEGTGLGLSTVYGIVEQAGGAIAVDTAPGEGTTVRVCLPPHIADHPPERAPTGVPRDETASGTGEVILLVDDDRPVREVTRRILERAGFTVVAMESGDAALRYCDSGAAPPDAVVSDIVMPGISGYRLVEELRRRYPGIRVLLMTGYTEDAPDSADDRLELLHKPFDARTMVRRLREQLAPA